MRNKDESVLQDEKSHTNVTQGNNLDSSILRRKKSASYLREMIRNCDLVTPNIRMLCVWSVRVECVRIEMTNIPSRWERNCDSDNCIFYADEKCEFVWETGCKRGGGKMKRNREGGREREMEIRKEWKRGREKERKIVWVGWRRWEGELESDLSVKIDYDLWKRKSA